MKTLTRKMLDCVLEPDDVENLNRGGSVYIGHDEELSVRISLHPSALPEPVGPEPPETNRKRRGRRAARVARTGGKKPYVCRKGCGKDFVRSQGRGNHETYCRGRPTATKKAAAVSGNGKPAKEPRGLCPYCPPHRAISYSKPAWLNNHIEREHPERYRDWLAAKNVQTSAAEA